MGPHSRFSMGKHIHGFYLWIAKSIHGNTGTWTIVNPFIPSIGGWIGCSLCMCGGFTTCSSTTSHLVFDATIILLGRLLF